MSLNGAWTYRSYHNATALIGDDAAAALALIFGEGVFTFTSGPEHRLHGTLDMGPGYALDLEGRIDGSEHGPQTVVLIGRGIAGTPTAGWQYDYHGALAWSWPDAVDQIPCLTGTVLRAVAHGPNAPAGVTASFIAVRRPAP